MILTQIDEQNLNEPTKHVEFESKNILNLNVLNSEQLLKNEIKKRTNMNELKYIEAEKKIMKIVNGNRASSQERVQVDNNSILREEDSNSLEIVVIAIEKNKSEIKIQGLDPANNKIHIVFLSEDWAKTTLNKGDLIKIIKDKEITENTIMVNNNQNMMILEPDTLISCTTVSDSSYCLRKSVIRTKVRDSLNSNPSILYGILLHKLFENCLKTKNFEKETMAEFTRQLIGKSLQDILMCELDENTVFEHMSSYFHNLINFAERNIKSKNEGVRSSNCKSNIKINHIYDIEENIWSKKYGLKGTIDVDIEYTTIDHTNKEERKRAPLEFKTGRNSGSISHKAQTILYCMLMEERYKQSLNNGILYYLKTNDIINYKTNKNEMRYLIMLRNELAKHIRDFNPENMPDVINDKHACTNCSDLVSCSIYKKIKDLENNNFCFDELYSKSTESILPKYMMFYKHWDKIITKEEQHSLSRKQPIWKDNPLEKEARGECLLNMIRVKSQKDEADGNKDRNRWCFKYEFIKDINSQSKVLITESSFAKGDYVIVSANENYGLAIGYVDKVKNESISIRLEKDLDYFNKHNSGTTFQNAKYRIEKESIFNETSIMRENMIGFIKNNSEFGIKLKRLLVDNEPPQFEKHLDIEEDFEYEDNNLNQDQKKAIKMALSMKDYLLILGMPGTGKTTTIASLINTITKTLKKSVLLTSHTNSAVDNVLEKLVKLGNGDSILRLGTSSRISEAIKPYHNQEAKTVKELRTLYMEKAIVATTCVGITHPLFSKRRFDYCIVDEASQISFPINLGPIQKADKFILIGDQYQLPPLSHDSNAGEEGMSNSLFRMLSKRHYYSIVNLTYQYRMNMEIMELCNKFVYGYALKCANNRVAYSTLQCQSGEYIENIHTHGTERQLKRAKSSNLCRDPKTCWLNDVLKEENSLIFINTDKIKGSESCKGTILCNETEAWIVWEIVTAMKGCNINEKNMGVISPYRNQLFCIQQLFKKTNTKVELMTVDKAQGRDFECIIISFVRSNNKNKVGELLKEWKRLNVALTRAKRKLILIGSKQTLSGGSILLNQLIEHIETRNMLLELDRFIHIS